MVYLNDKTTTEKINSIQSIFRYSKYENDVIILVRR